MTRQQLGFRLTVGAALVLLGATSGVASDPPHWTGAELAVDCTTPCHVAHHAAGGGLTAAAANVNLCQTCHNPSGSAAAMAINTVDSAVPGSGGTSHAFNVTAINPVMGTLLPQDAEMLLRVVEGNVVCSTCHNQHTASSTFGGRSRVRPTRLLTSQGSTGALTSGGAFTGTRGVWYLVEVTQAGDQDTARFRYSKDNGISWFAERSAGPAVPLDSGVTVGFGVGAYVPGERWEFGATWPFLRARLDEPGGAGSAMCRDCHRDWDMTHVEVETYDGTMKSHPVGVGLDANGRGYDRSTPLDGNGAGQGTAGADTNASNDLNLDALDDVQCLTCHGVHFADSNTLTEDGP